MAPSMTAMRCRSIVRSWCSESAAEAGLDGCGVGCMQAVHKGADETRCQENTSTYHDMMMRFCDRHLGGQTVPDRLRLPVDRLARSRPRTENIRANVFPDPDHKERFSNFSRQSRGLNSSGARIRPWFQPFCPGTCSVLCGRNRCAVCSRATGVWGKQHWRAGRRGSRPALALFRKPDG